MADDATTEEGRLMTQVSRRSLLRAGTIAGAAVWTVPAVNLIGLGAGSAQAASGGTSAVDRRAAFGAFLVQVGNKHYAYQVQPGSTQPVPLAAGTAASLLASRNGVKVEDKNSPPNPPRITLGETTLSNGDTVLFVQGVDTGLLAFANHDSFALRPDNELSSPHYRSGAGPAPLSASGTVSTTTEDPGFATFLLATPFNSGWIFLKD